MSFTAAPVKHPVRRQPLNLREPAKPSKRVAEVAGGTAAECAAVVCCCPCGLAKLLVLTVVKLPVCLWRRAVRKRMKRHAAGKRNAESKDSWSDICAASLAAAAVEQRIPSPANLPAAEFLEVENEMWHRIFGNGFWRNPSPGE